MSEDDIDLVEQMIQQALEAHNHLGHDSAKLTVNSINEFSNAPITISNPPPFNSTSTGGAAVLTTADAAVIAAIALTVTQMYTAFKAEGLIK